MFFTKKGLFFISCLAIGGEGQYQEFQSYLSPGLTHHVNRASSTPINKFQSYLSPGLTLHRCGITLSPLFLFQSYLSPGLTIMLAGSTSEEATFQSYLSPGLTGFDSSSDIHDNVLSILP